MNNCFHANFSQRLRRLLHERETGRLLKGRQTKARLTRGPLVWPLRSFDPEGVWDVFWFSIKVFLVPPPTNTAPPSLGELSEQSRAESNNKSCLPPPPSGEPSFLCVELGPALTHWLFYLMWNSTRSAKPRQLLPQHNNQTPLSPLCRSFCLSFACRHKQPELCWF